jgi:hypothetical protein
LDQQSQDKENKLLRIRDEARKWLDKEQQAEAFLAFHQGNVEWLTDQITSDKFVSDHSGYLLALGGLKAHRAALDAINTASARATKATKELEELEKELKRDA